MGLRAKLFVTIGTLLIIYVLLILFIPTYIVLKDVNASSEHLYSLIIRNNERMSRAEELLVAELFENLRESLESFMTLATYVDNIRELLGPNEEIPVQEVLANTANFNPQFGYFQVDGIHKNLNLALTVTETKLYTPIVKPIDDRLVYIEIPKVGAFLGIPIPHNSTSLFSGEYYALVGWDQLSRLEAIEEELETFKEEYGSGKNLHLDTTFQDPSPPALSRNAWSRRNLLIQILVPLIFDTNLIYKGEEWVPAGIAHILPNGRKEAILTRELINFNPQFDAKAFFAEHPPKKGQREVAGSDFFLADDHLHFVYLGNTLKTDNAYFSLAVPIDPLARELASWTDKTVILKVGDRINAYGPLGSIASDFSEQHHIFGQSRGTIELGHKTYFFANLTRLEQGHIAFYLLTPLDDHESIAKASLTLSHTTAKKISLQLFIISVIIALLIFIAISRLALIEIIRPIVKLTATTDLVVAGDFETIELPKIGKRKDEVARLINDFEKMVKGLKEKEKIRGVLNKVVSKEIADEILQTRIQLGGEEREMTVLFGDIRGFTRMTEHLPPKETIELLNECMTQMTDKVDLNEGIVDKYVGDEIMVLYGVPIPKENHPHLAVKTAVEMQQALVSWNEKRKSEGKPVVAMGFGIHSGVAVAGNMGANNRLNYTVVGTTVNISARLCSAAKPGQILISKETADQVKDHFKLNPLEPILLKGITDPFPVYEVIA